MIIKSMTRRRGIKQLVGYMFKEHKGDDKNLHPMTMKHNLSGRDRNRWVKQMEFNESLRKNKRKDAIAVYHEVVSFHKDDSKHINRKVLEDFGKKFIELRGKQNIYIMREHRDRHHIHIHIAMSGTEFLTGKANRITKAEFDKFRKDMEKYQKEKFPVLRHSLAYGRPKILDRKQVRENNKSTITKVLADLFDKAKSEKEFIDGLASSGQKPYYRGGKLTGIEFGGMKFRLARLGYDARKFKELDQEEPDVQTKLDELDALRNEIKTQEKEQEHDRELDRAIDNTEDNEVEEDTDYEVTNEL